MKNVFNSLITRAFLNRKARKYFNLTSHFLTFMRHTTAVWPILIGIEKLKEYKNVLVLAPHPDDEVFGMGGTLLILKELHSKVRIVWMTNRLNKTRTSESMAVLNRLDISQSFDETFPFSGEHIIVSEIKRYLAQLISEISPQLICTPSIFDSHIDHARLNLALAYSINRAKWNGNIFQYEVWNTLIPNALINITDVIDNKYDLMQLYKSQTSENKFAYTERMISLNKYRGLSNTIGYAEGFIHTLSESYCKLVLKNKVE